MSAFADVRVLDFSTHFAVAMAVMHLGDFGAEVIKVDPTAEERGRGEPVGGSRFRRSGTIGDRCSTSGRLAEILRESREAVSRGCEDERQRVDAPDDGGVQVAGRLVRVGPIVGDATVQRLQRDA